MSDDEATAIASDLVKGTAAFTAGLVLLGLTLVVLL